MRAKAVVVRGMRTLALLLGAAALAGAAPAEAQDARVLGRVTDGVGNAVAGARVALVPEGRDTPSHETVSGQTGGFQFAGVPAGTYTLRAAREGVGARERRITVRAGRVVSQVVRLQRARSARPVASGAGRPGG